MSRVMHGRAVLRQVRDVMVVGGGQTTSHITLPISSPSISPFLLFQSPSIGFPPCRYFSLASSQSAYLSSVISSSPSLPSSRPSVLPPIHPFILSARLSTSPLCLKIRSKVIGEEPSKSKKKQYVAPFITLIDLEDKISKMGLDQAERLAKRRDLKLVKVEDPSLTGGGKDVYKLLTGKQYFEEVRSKKSEKSTAGSKDEKTLSISGNISQHDLAFKLQSIVKWLNKGHQIRVNIGAKRTSKEDMESVFSAIENEVKQHRGRILQRHEKMEDIRFYIAPPKVKEEEAKASKGKSQEDSHVSDESTNDKTKE